MELKDILSGINDQLRFSETKIAALLAFNGALTFGVIRLFLISNKTELQTWTILFFIIIISISFISIFFAILPTTNNKTKNTDSPKNINIIFYNDIIKTNSNNYLETYYTKNKIASKDRKEIDIDIANQIIKLSLITSKKFEIFKISLVFTMLSLATSLFFAITLLC